MEWVLWTVAGFCVLGAGNTALWRWRISRFLAAVDDARKRKVTLSREITRREEELREEKSSVGHWLLSFLIFPLHGLVLNVPRFREESRWIDEMQQSAGRRKAAQTVPSTPPK